LKLHHYKRNLSLWPFCISFIYGRQARALSQGPGRGRGLGAGAGAGHAGPAQHPASFPSITTGGSLRMPCCFARLPFLSGYRALIQRTPKHHTFGRPAQGASPLERNGEIYFRYKTRRMTVYRLSDPGFDGEVFADGVEPSKACGPVLPVVCLKGIGV